MTRLIDADKLNPDCLTKDGKLAISQSQLANAPTVEPEITNDDLQAAMTESYHLGYELAETKFKRPTGELIAREDMDYRDENKVIHKHFMCDKCGFIHDFIDGHTSQYNFCPNCGADMRGSEDADQEV